MDTGCAGEDGEDDDEEDDDEEEDDEVGLSFSSAGTQNPSLVQALATIIFVGLNCTQRTGPVCPAQVPTSTPDKVSHNRTVPSSLPEATKFASGENDASSADPVLFTWEL